MHNTYFSKIVTYTIIIVIVILSAITIWKIDQCANWYLGSEDETKLEMLNARVYNLESRYWKLEEEIYKMRELK